MLLAATFFFNNNKKKGYVDRSLPTWRWHCVRTQPPQCLNLDHRPLYYPKIIKSKASSSFSAGLLLTLLWWQHKIETKTSKSPNIEHCGPCSENIKSLRKDWPKETGPQMSHSLLENLKSHVKSSLYSSSVDTQDKKHNEQYQSYPK